MMPEFVPAILPDSPEDLVEKVAELPAEVNFFHLDVLGPDLWTHVSKPFEVHLMIDDPASQAEMWIERGARRIISHKLDQKILDLRSRAEVGLAFELSQPIEDVLALAEFSDFVHIMSIAEIGEQGHPLDERVFDRIKRVQEKFPGKIISVDGGVTSENFQKLIDLGADRLVVGSHFKNIWSKLNKDVPLT